MQAVKIGPQFEADSQMGPLISATQRERVQGFVNRAQANGATIVTGGGIPAGFDRGYYFEPTVICDADQKAEIIQAEAFGTVASSNQALAKIYRPKRWAITRLPSM